MFRILYLVVFALGLLWIVQTRPIWLEPTRALEEPPRHAVAGQPDWQRDEEARTTETWRRIRITTLGVLGVIVASEVWCLLAGRLRSFYRI